MEIEKKYTCCFIGYRMMGTSTILSKKLVNAIEKLIVEEKVCTFLFSGTGKFDCLCFYATSFLKQKYPHIQRIKVRTNFSLSNSSFIEYTFENDYDDNFYPGRRYHTNKIFRGNSEKERIDMSNFCIAYYNKDHDFTEELLCNSGELTTKVGIAYAKSKDTRMIQVDKI